MDDRIGKETYSNKHGGSTSQEENETSNLKL